MAGFGPPSDRKNRREWWRRQIERHEQSGLSVVQFCARIGVRPKMFYAWRQRLSEASSASSHTRGERDPYRSLNLEGSPAVPFVPVAIRADSAAGHLEITLTNSSVLRLTGAVDPHLLRVAIDGAGRLPVQRRGTR